MPDAESRPSLETPGAGPLVIPIGAALNRDVILSLQRRQFLITEPDTVEDHVSGRRVRSFYISCRPFSLFCWFVFVLSSRSSVEYRETDRRQQNRRYVNTHHHFLPSTFRAPQTFRLRRLCFEMRAAKEI